MTGWLDVHGWLIVIIGAGTLMLVFMVLQALEDGRGDDEAHGRLEEQVDQ